MVFDYDYVIFAKRSAINSMNLINILAGLAKVSLQIISSR